MAYFSDKNHPFFPLLFMPLNSIWKQLVQTKQIKRSKRHRQSQGDLNTQQINPRGRTQVSQSLVCGGTFGFSPRDGPKTHQRHLHLLNPPNESSVRAISSKLIISIITIINSDIFFFLFIFFGLFIF